MPVPLYNRSRILFIATAYSRRVQSTTQCRSHFVLCGVSCYYSHPKCTVYFKTWSSLCDVCCMPQRTHKEYSLLKQQTPFCSERCILHIATTYTQVVQFAKRDTVMPCKKGRILHIATTYTQGIQYTKKTRPRFIMRGLSCILPQPTPKEYSILKRQDHVF